MLAVLFAELRGLVLKTLGLADVLKVALGPLLPQIELAFVYSSVAKQQDTPLSDIGVMIVSPNLGYANVFGALESAAARRFARCGWPCATPTCWPASTATAKPSMQRDPRAFETCRKSWRFAISLFMAMPP